MSSLELARAIVISPDLAVAIGLEEAVLLRVLGDFHALRVEVETSPEGGTAEAWFDLPLSSLIRQTPFWSETDLLRVLASLIRKGMVRQSAGSGPRGELRLAFTHGPQQTTGVQSPPPPRPRPPTDQRLAAPLPADWSPDTETLEQCEQLGIPRWFVKTNLGEFQLYWRERGEAHPAWNSKFLQHLTRLWRRRPDDQGTAELPMPRDWRPAAEAVTILTRAGVDAGFIEDSLPEFVLYWRGRGLTSNVWDSKFIKHTRRQWHCVKSGLEFDTQPTPIPANWQPSRECFDVLKMAQIDEDFARELVGEFVLFWRDSNRPHRSWNSKFIRHAKYLWALRHRGEAAAEDGQAAARRGPKGRRTVLERLTDRSWADGVRLD